MSMRNLIQLVYWKITPERQEWLGVKYFKWSADSDTVVLVVREPGEMKRGRNHAVGIHCIAKQTMASNYIGVGYIELCTKSEYDKAFNQVVKLLQ